MRQRSARPFGLVYILTPVTPPDRTHWNPPSVNHRFGLTTPRLVAGGRQGCDGTPCLLGDADGAGLVSTMVMANCPAPTWRKIFVLTPRKTLFLPPAEVKRRSKKDEYNLSRAGSCEPAMAPQVPRHLHLLFHPRPARDLKSGTLASPSLTTGRFF